MKSLDLVTTTQGIRGGKNKNNDVGYSLATAKKNGNTLVQISVDTFEGAGATYKERETPHIEIYFPGFEMWKGTPEQLKAALKVEFL